jgi:hypothetical protein
MSILSYPERGHWGDSKWRGNCSGHVYREIFERLQPKTFCDPMMGSGTSIDVCKEMKIEHFGLDLHQGFNILRHSILEKIGKPVDLNISHPPYHDMILYSGQVWGSQPHPDDLSHCISVADFHEKMQLALINQRESVKPGGYFGTIIGDQRKNGEYHSLQAEMIARMPSSELAAVLIKAQHNTQSGRKSYGKMTLPPITHEYVILWKRKEIAMFSFLKSVATEAQNRLTGTWRNVVRQCLMGLGGESDLKTLYEHVEQSCDKARSNVHWRDKVRQVLNSHPQYFKSNERGVWALA